MGRFVGKREDTVAMGLNCWTRRWWGGGGRREETTDN